MQRHNPIVQGSLLAIAAAVLFGATTPVIQHFGVGVGPFATAALLYGGAALGCGLTRSGAGEKSLGSGQVPRVVLIALFGAALAPAALAWGLQRAGALAASLLLNLEAVFTVALAWVIYREPLGRRVVVAATLMVIGGGVLAFRKEDGASASALGLATLVAATLAWALDNTLTRPLSDFDPRAVVFWKGSCGAALSALVAWLARDSWPALPAILALLACGATGYGLSLRLYLRAQRALGAARTGSLFAFGPFVGTDLAFTLGDRAGGTLVFLAAALFVVAVYLHLTEEHHHLHRHEAMDHEHTHRHDDGHHLHLHDPPVVGAHSHVHHHEAAEHDHPHGADMHHRHEHR